MKKTKFALFLVALLCATLLFAQSIDYRNRTWTGTQDFRTNVTFAGLTLRMVSGTLTPSQVRNLNGTRVDVIPAVPGKAIIVVQVQYQLDFRTTAYDSVGAGEDLLLNYLNGTAQVGEVCDNSTCLDGDATADAFATVTGTVSHRLSADDPVQVSILSGEWASTDADSAGDSPIHYRIWYYTVDADISTIAP